MAPENFKINSLGAFYFFSHFKAAFILLLNSETSFLFCVFLFLGLAVKVQTHLFHRSMPSVFGQCSWESWPPRLPVQNRLLISPQALLFAFCVPVSWRLPFFFFSSIMACGWEVTWITLCSFQWCGVFWRKYFWQNMFHWVLNDFSKMSVIRASHLGKNTYQATFRFER